METFRDVAQTFRGAAETLRDVAETFRGVAELFRDVAETFRSVAETLRDVAELSRGVAETLRGVAELFAVCDWRVRLRRARPSSSARSRREPCAEATCLEGLLKRARLAFHSLLAPAFVVALGLARGLTLGLGATR